MLPGGPEKLSVVSRPGLRLRRRVAVERPPGAGAEAVGGAAAAYLGRLSALHAAGARLRRPQSAAGATPRAGRGVCPARQSARSSGAVAYRPEERGRGFLPVIERGIAPAPVAPARRRNAARLPKALIDRVYIPRW